MRIKEIAGVSVVVDLIHTIDYDVFFDMALHSPKYYLKLNAEDRILKEFRKHGVS